MPKIPRDISANKLIKLLNKYEYKFIREEGSHIRIFSNFKSKPHKITIPDHNPIKIGTLNNILNDISNYLEITKSELLIELFGK